MLLDKFFDLQSFKKTKNLKLLKNSNNHTTLVCVCLVGLCLVPTTNTGTKDPMRSHQPCTNISLVGRETN
jgi:hypothetical protein